MGLKNYSYGQLFVAFLLFNYVMATSATNMAQLKNQQQQALGQTPTTSIEQHQTQHQHQLQQQQQHNQQQRQRQEQQQHHQLQHQSLQRGGLVAHPEKSIISSANGVLLASNTGHVNMDSQALTSASASTLAHSPPAHYVVHEKEAAIQEILKQFNKDNDLNDSYQIFNELRRDTHDNSNHELPPPPPLVASLAAFPWNLYDRPYAPFTTLPPSTPQMAGLFSTNFNPFESFNFPFPVTPRLLPLMSYTQPIYIPYPFIMSPEMFYPSYSSLPHLSNSYEESMSRGAGSSRRTASSQHSTGGYSRNSPIYYVRLPPTPYMFLSSLGAPSMPGYSNMLPYPSLPSSFPSFSPIFNVPINFLANGKPSNIYQMSSAPPNDMQNPLQFSNVPSTFNTRPPPPPPLNAYRPAASSHNYYNTHPPAASYSGSSTATSSPATSSSSSVSHQDSKLTALKRSYFFNGRPEDIYILPNDFNPLYSSDSNYY